MRSKLGGNNQKRMLKMTTNNTRIYKKVIDVNQKDIKDFWNKRAKSATTLKGVLLGEKFGPTSGELRNIKEKSILKDFLPTDCKLDVLDIGCGMGRWLDNLQGYVNVYHGIDLSDEFVYKAKKIYSGTADAGFFVMSATDIDRDILLSKYDLVIITGVIMYINDDCLNELFNTLSDFVKTQGMIYLQESVSIMEGRLTLKDFLSEELNCNYSAIYRTSAEYEMYIKRHLNDFKLLKSDLLLDEFTGAREETNARYWVLKKH